MASPLMTRTCLSKMASAYPPSWNFAGKYLIDQCGKLVGAAGNSASEPWTTVAPMVAKLLATTPKC